MLLRLILSINIILRKEVFMSETITPSLPESAIEDEDGNFLNSIVSPSTFTVISTKLSVG